MVSADRVREKATLDPWFSFLGSRSGPMCDGSRTVKNPDGFLCSLQGETDGPHVATAVDVPFDVVALSLGSETLEAV